MQGLQRGAFLACLLAWTAAAALPARAGTDRFTEPLPLMPVVVATRSHGWLALSPQFDLALARHRIQAPGAAFIKVHFSEFSLPPGVWVEVTSPDGSETWRYGPGQSDPFTFDAELGDDGRRRFSAMSITGDTAVLRLAGELQRFDARMHVVEIDSWLEGLADNGALPGVSGNAKEGADIIHRTENACGSTYERYGAVCWADSHPWEYQRSAAVAKLITSRGEVCTAWRVGADNHLFTAGHCLGRQSELSGAELWFDYEAVSCGGSQNQDAVKVAGGTLLATDPSLDYTLFTVSDFSAIADFPAFGLEVGGKTVGEPLWIPQHGLGKPRQIALESDMNDSGLCEIDALDLDGYAEGSDIGYYCDTTTSSSGSPVVAYETGRVLALHHFGGCMNSGVDFSRIWPQVSDFFGGRVPSGNSGGSGGGVQPAQNQAPQAVFEAACNELDCSFDASDSSDADGELTGFSWQFGDGSGASGPVVQHRFDAEGSYTVVLTVEDDDGAGANASQTVGLALPNLEPVATFSSHCTYNACTFDGSGSRDEDGSVVDWTWSLGDGSSARGASVQHEYAQAGTYTITLTVADDEGGLDSGSRTVTLNMPNASPVADFAFSCDGTHCTFDAAASHDPDGTVTAWVWAFGDGVQGSGKQVSHSYAAAGAFLVTLKVQDDAGGSGERGKTVQTDNRQQDSNAAPQADFSYLCDAAGCVFDASGSSDAEGAIAAYRWTLGDGSFGEGQVLEHAYANSGSFRVTLEIEDGQGLTATRSRTVEFDKAEEPEQDIVLSGHGARHGGRTVAVLRWTGAQADQVEIYRDGGLLATTPNDGKHVDALPGERLKPVAYRVCIPASDRCSNLAGIEFRF